MPKIKIKHYLLIVMFLMLAGCGANKTGFPLETEAPITADTPAIVNKPTATDTPVDIGTVATTETPAATSKPAAVKPVKYRLSPYADIRGLPWNDPPQAVYGRDEYRVFDIYTYTFNELTILEGSEKQQAAVMEKGRNPGLGVRALHAEGVTGEGVNVAIIDQNMLLDHPEFKDKIIKYYDTGCEQDENSGSMHGPAVTSLLVGETLGVAPGARVYYVAAPSWKLDSAYYADALFWIIAENEKLPEGEKIRVVSVSAAPSGLGTPFTKNAKMWDEAVKAAQEAGMLVLDCRNDDTTGIISPLYYDTLDPDNFALCRPGFPSNGSDYVPKGHYICVPTSFRTVAEEYEKGHPSYQYTGEGGLSWGIPYASGVLAMGWQIDPTLSPEEIVDLLFETAYSHASGFLVINPPAFVEAVKARIS